MSKTIIARQVSITLLDLLQSRLHDKYSMQKDKIDEIEKIETLQYGVDGR